MPNKKYILDVRAEKQYESNMEEIRNFLDVLVKNGFDVSYHVSPHDRPVKEKKFTKYYDPHTLAPSKIVIHGEDSEWYITDEGRQNG